MHDNLALAHFQCGEPGHFRTENQCDWILPRMAEQFQCSPSRIENLMRKIAWTGGNGRCQNRAAQCLVQVCANFGIVQDVPRAGGAPFRFLVGKGFGIHQIERIQPHRFHRPRRGAYIAGMAGDGLAPRGHYQADGRIHIKIRSPLTFRIQTMQPMLTIAVKAARRAGGIINRAAQNLDLLHVSRKAHSDFVSEVDGAAEEAIIGDAAGCLSQTIPF